MTDLVTTMLTADEARALTDDIRRRVTDLLPLITQAYEQRADRALGYATWADYCASELSGLRVPLADRPAMVAELRQTGMSTRAIGSALGVSEGTVRNDLSTAQNYAVGQPERITSLDGRERPAKMPARQDVADAILADIDQAANTLPKPDPMDDARRDEELDDVMTGTAARFRRNYAEAAAKAMDLTTFDPERIAEVFSANFPRDVNDLLNRLDRWVSEVRAAHHDRQRSGLRVISGGAR